TTLIIITNQHPFNTPAFREVGRIFDVSNLYLFYYSLLINIAAVNYNIIRLNI
ncbi:hypothetical protein K469DRAFT_576104, partial [Zopfia rhizophila CBS 207.26]